jgi:hypothetical protein
MTGNDSSAREDHDSVVGAEISVILGSLMRKRGWALYVTYFSVDKWVGPSDHGEELEAHSIRDIVSAIKNLNGRDRTNVILQSYKERSMTIGGGNEGRYIAFVTVDRDLKFYNLINPKAADGTIDVVAGGQAGSFPARQVVDLRTVLKAAKYFAKFGRREPSLKWERQK